MTFTKVFVAAEAGVVSVARAAARRRDTPKHFPAVRVLSSREFWAETDPLDVGDKKLLRHYSCVYLHAEDEELQSLPPLRAAFAKTFAEFFAGACRAEAALRGRAAIGAVKPAIGAQR